MLLSWLRTIRNIISSAVPLCAVQQVDCCGDSRGVRSGPRREGQRVGQLRRQRLAADLSRVDVLRLRRVRVSGYSLGLGAGLGLGLGLG